MCHSLQRARGERGYILLVLLLVVAMLSIASLTLVQSMEFRMRRDREEELIHRGVQYSRAMRRFYKKFGRYPTTIEELESTNNIRFLRKRYKDPMNRDPKTGKERDFRLLHMQDVQASFNGGAGAGLTSVAGLANQQANASALKARIQALDGFNPGGGPGPQNLASGNSANAVSADQSASNDTQSAPTDQGSSGSDATGAPPPRPLSQQLGPNGQPQVFGGGAIVGVASASKEKTIREFNKKDHYNQWQFIYDPTTDRGGMLMTPNQPPLQGVQQVNPQPQNGQGGFGGQNPSGLGNTMTQPSMPTSPALSQQ